MLGRTAGEVHSAHWYLEEHASRPCCLSCPMCPLFGLNIRSIEDLEGIGIARLLDWPKSEFAAYIFGANEPSDRLITSQHDFVIIDNEQMFSTGPCSFESARWLQGVDGIAYSKGQDLAAETCAQVASITSQKLSDVLTIPRDIKVHQKWSIAKLIKQSITFAAKCHNKYQST